MAKKEAERWASMIGHGFAHLQDGIDMIVDFGFKQLKKAGDHKVENEKSQNPYVVHAKKFGLGATKFLGILGDEYYKKYAELKRKTK